MKTQFLLSCTLSSYDILQNVQSHSNLTAYGHENMTPVLVGSPPSNLTAYGSCSGRVKPSGQRKRDERSPQRKRDGHTPASTFR